jgi:hypothetical protein
MTGKEDDGNEFEKLKLMYDNVYDELNRSRDWPIKIMAFATAVYIAIYGLLKFDSTNICLSIWIKGLLMTFIVLLTLITYINILNQHLNYLKYRDIQIRIQNKLNIQNLEVNNGPIFPIEWTNKQDEKQKFGLGWHFYASYIIVLAIIAIMLILMQ